MNIFDKLGSESAETGGQREWCGSRGLATCL